MKILLGIRPVWLLILFAVIDIVCIGMGMGVPFFCILFGFVSGWVVARYILPRARSTHVAMRTILAVDAATAGFTLLAMAILWLPFATYYFDPAKDLANTGIPMILFTPKASFIGWIALMVVISPFLQFLTTVFASYLALASSKPEAAP